MLRELGQLPLCATSRCHVEIVLLCASELDKEDKMMISKFLMILLTSNTLQRVGGGGGKGNV